MLLLLPKNLRWSQIWPSYPWTKKIQRLLEIKGHAVFSTNKLSTCSQVATFAMGWFWGPQARLILESWAVATPIRPHLSQTFQAQFDKVPGVLKTLRSEIFRVGFRLILCKPVGWAERHGNVGSLHWCVFWCWWNVIGFLRTVGYTGGRNPKPSYETVCGGDGHTEVSHQSGFSFSWL